jgi:hypothetical protein
MKIQLRYRAKADESIAERHLDVMSALAGISKPWGLEGAELIPIPDIADKLAIEVEFTPDPSNDIGGYISYPFRSEAYLRDKAQYDDLMIVEFEPEKVDFAHVVQTVFPLYVKAFKAYRATIITDEDLALDDWDMICEISEETGLDVNGRDGVYRIASVNYFDRELCHRAFGLDPEKIVAYLNGQVELVKVLENGVLLIVTSQRPTRQEIELIDERIRGQIGVPLASVLEAN